MVGIETEGRAIQEPKFDRASWWTVGTLLLLALISATTAGMILARPGDGCVLDASQISGQFIHTCVGHWPTPLRPGDEVLAVAGQPIDSSSLEVVWLPAPPGWHEEGSAHYLVRRNGQTLDLEVPLHRLSLPGVFHALSVVMSLTLLDWLSLQFLTVIVIFILAPRNRGAQLLLLAVSSLTILTTFLGANGSITVSERYLPRWLFVVSFLLSTSWYQAFIPTMLLLVLAFPRRTWPLVRFPRLAPLLIYGIPLTASAVTLISGNGILSLAVLGVGAVSVIVTFAAATALTLLRVHDRIIRAQTAWLGLGLTVGLASVVLEYLAATLLPGLSATIVPVPGWIIVIPALVQALALPVCTGIAITQYGLFEIEVVIRRALIYGVLTVLLVLLYFGAVVFLQSLFRALTGQTSPLAVVASTLVSAALFNPLRHRVQHFIDRRFFRRRYRAEQVLTAFSTVLRQRETADIDRLTGELLGVIQETMQPRYLSLWLRDEVSPSSNRR
jgi:hypothetical protein